MSPIYLAIDTPDLMRALWLVEETKGFVAGIKVGLTLWAANGPLVRNVIGNSDWFLDVKWHDIPVQVASAVEAVVPMRPNFITLHEKGGAEMMAAAAASATMRANDTSVPRPKLLAVTTLTSQTASLSTICRQAHRAIDCGMDGVISSPSPDELRMLRSEIGTKPIIMTPGVRRADDPVDEHQRRATPREAMEAGATFLVIGRPITAAASPRDAIRAILADL